MTFDKILIVDDEPSIHRLLEHHLRRQHYKVSVAGTLAKAEALLAEEHFDLALIDLCVPDGDGLEFLKRATQSPGAPVAVAMSGYGSVETAIRCIRNGAFDYIVKPFSLEELDLVIDRAESFRQMLQINRYMERELRCDGAILGESPAIAQLRSMIQKVAPTETTVLILGESGAGKQQVAEAVHRASARASGPLIKVNCAAGTEDQIERELFGMELESEEGRGGWLELANGGTLVLEEISELPLRAQVKVLRVLQEQQFERSGCGKPVPVNIRLVATSHRDLAACVARGAFRQDLFFRLNVLPLPVPALRERLADIPLLVAHWLEMFGRRNGLKLGGISEGALRNLMAYSWPGNVRELENALERAVILSGFSQRLEAEAFDFLKVPPAPRMAGMSNSAGAASFNAAAPGSEEPLLTLDELERRHVLRALEHTNQNRTRAASLLKISVRTLRNKLHQYRLEDSSGCRQSQLAMVSPAAANTNRAAVPGAFQ